MNLKTHPDILEEAQGNLKLRVWHVPNPPREAFRVEVSSPEEALKVLNNLAQYDLYLDTLGKDTIFMNAQGLEYFNRDDNEWQEWVNEDDLDIADAERWAEGEEE